jgi:NtrC-family two-component system response regulator AlgB
VGSASTRRADVRIIAATNRDLEAAVKNGRFREDLFYRLNVIRIEIPPLRERPDDIAPLAEKLLAFFGRAGHRLFLGFTPEARDALIRYNWPGNLRELRNVVERAAIICQSDQVGVECLPENLLPAVSGPRLGERITLERIEEEHIRRVLAMTRSLQDAADVLGIDQATLWRRRKKYGI